MVNPSAMVETYSIPLKSWNFHWWIYPPKRNPANIAQISQGPISSTSSISLLCIPSDVAKEDTTYFLWGLKVRNAAVSKLGPAMR
jgi:hypothetical protein